MRIILKSQNSKLHAKSSCFNSFHIFFAACGCTEKSKQLTEQEFQSRMVEPILNKTSSFVQECQYRDEENMSVALEELEGLVQHMTYTHNLSNHQRQSLTLYQAEVLPKFHEVVEILAKPSLDSDEFQLAVEVLNKAQEKSRTILN